MELLCWLGVITLFAVGWLGTVVPMLPGTAIILAAAVLHRVALGGAKSVNWFVIALLVALTAASYGIDIAAGYLGAQRFGATRWGTFGAIVGALVGLFFGLPGILIGPVVGVVIFEFSRNRRLIAAGKAGWGSLLGTIGGMIAKLLIALAMIVIFLMNAPSPF